MENVTYIVPIHKIEEDVKDFFVKAVESISSLDFTEGDKVLFVGPKEVLNQIDVLIHDVKLFHEIVYLENEDTDFFKQINKAAFNCVTPYFSILEFDDAYFSNWNKCAQEYAVNGASILIPINEYYEGRYFDKSGKLVSFGNEIAWNSSFASDGNTETWNGSSIGESRSLGYLDIDCLNTFGDFNCTGAFFRTEDFISIGGLKPTLKIAAWYEFLLRAVYNGKIVYVVPKIGYKHTLGRKDSFSFENRGISQEEGKWYFTTAQQEYFFKEDRNKVYKDDTSE